MLYNIHTLDYDKDLLKLFDIPEKMLPKVLASNSIFGHCSLFKEFPICNFRRSTSRVILSMVLIKMSSKTLMAQPFIVATTGKAIPKSKSLVNTIAWTLDNEQPMLEGSIFIGGNRTMA